MMMPNQGIKDTEVITIEDSDEEVSESKDKDPPVCRAYSHSKLIQRIQQPPPWYQGRRVTSPVAAAHGRSMNRNIRSAIRDQNFPIDSTPRSANVSIRSFVSKRERPTEEAFQEVPHQSQALLAIFAARQKAQRTRRISAPLEGQQNPAHNPNVSVPASATPATKKRRITGGGLKGWKGAQTITPLGRTMFNSMVGNPLCCFIEPIGADETALAWATRNP